MTKYLQAKYEALVLNDIPLPTEVRVNKYLTNHPDEFTRKELDDVTTVFKSLETGLRQGTIFPNDLYRALTRLGLNPTEQEIVDIDNYIAKFDIQFDAEEMVIESVYRDDTSVTSFLLVSCGRKVINSLFVRFYYSNKPGYHNVDKIITKVGTQLIHSFLLGV